MMFEPPAARRWRRWSRRLPSLVLWLVAVVTATGLYVRQHRGVTVTGFAEATPYRVAGIRAGRLREISVVPDQSVRAGQAVAWLDDRAVLLDLGEVQAELVRLRHENDGRLADWRLATQNRDADGRRFVRDIESARISHLERRAELVAARAELFGLESNLTRALELRRGDHISQAELEVDSVACVAQQAIVDGLVVQVELLSQREIAARERYRDFAPGDDDAATASLLAALDARVAVQEFRIERAETALADCVLRAPIDGVVAAVLCRQGEVVTAGECVVTVVPPQAAEVVAFVPEDRIPDVAIGDLVALQARTGGAKCEGRVVSLGAALDQLPRRTDPVNPVPGWGLTVRVRLPDKVRVRPGTAFTVVF